MLLILHFLNACCKTICYKPSYAKRLINTRKNSTEAF